MDQLLDDCQFELRHLVLWLNPNSLLKLMLRTLILPTSPQYNTPNNPILCIPWLLLNTLPYLTNSFNHVTQSELCEGPVAVGVVVVAVLLFCFLADLDGF